jgi:post-segregation antitoxin (ccd killing protein)
MKQIVSMLEACYFPDMPAIQVKNVPQELHDQLREIAELQKCTIGDVILEAIKQEIRRQKHTQWLDEVFAHPTGLKSTAEERQAFIDELRAERDAR